MPKVTRLGSLAWGIALILLPLIAMGEPDGTPGEMAKEPEAAAISACNDCHAGYEELLPGDHPSVQGDGLDACVTCHRWAITIASGRNPFSTHMHLAHVPPKGDLECDRCHSWTVDEHFGLIGQPYSWGKPTALDIDLIKGSVMTWADSRFMDHLHARADVSCTNCHGNLLPQADSSVDNDRCLMCHGPLEQLVKRSEPSDFADRNPHQSHLGEIACTVCHKAHLASSVYCLGCHRNFTMTIPGDGAATP